MFALGEATVWPLFSLVFAEAVSIVVQNNQSAQQLALWCGMMVVIGAGTVITTAFRLTFTSMAGGLLTKHLRNTIFKFYVDQDVGWFDDKAHSQGMNFPSNDGAKYNFK